MQNTIELSGVAEAAVKGFMRKEQALLEMLDYYTRRHVERTSQIDEELERENAAMWRSLGEALGFDLSVGCWTVDTQYYAATGRLFLVQAASPEALETPHDEDVPTEEEVLLEERIHEMLEGMREMAERFGEPAIQEILRAQCRKHGLGGDGGGGVVTIPAGLLRRARSEDGDDAADADG